MSGLELFTVLRQLVDILADEVAVGVVGTECFFDHQCGRFCFGDICGKLLEGAVVVDRIRSQVGLIDIRPKDMELISLNLGQTPL